MRALLSLLFVLHSPAAPSPIAKVLAVSGLVSREPSHKALLPGAMLSEGDRVTVESVGFLRLRLDNGEVLEIGHDSELSFHRLLSGAQYAELPHGSVLSVAARPTPLEIHSGEIRLHLDGRAFFFEQRADQRAYLCVCDGSAKAQWGDTKVEISGQLHHHGAYLSATSTKAEPGPAKPLDHSDARLKELRALL